MVEAPREKEVGRSPGVMDVGQVVVGRPVPPSCLVLVVRMKAESWMKVKVMV